MIGLVIKFVIEISFEHLFSIGETKMPVRLPEETKITAKTAWTNQSDALNVSFKIIFETTQYMISFSPNLVVSNFTMY